MISTEQAENQTSSEIARFLSACRKAKSTVDGLIKKGAALASRPPWNQFRLVAGAFARSFGFGHLLRHFRLDGVKVEARAALHRRVGEEGLDFLAHHLLDEHEAPELIHIIITKE